MSQPTAFTTGIVPRDFSHLTTDVLRDVWTIGKMRHVIAALRGDLVSVILDTRTGHAASGVVLTGARESLSGGPQLDYSWTGADGIEYHGCAYLRGVGAIIPLTDRPGTRGAKWDATDSHRTEGSAAIAIAAEKHGDAEGRSWGSWTFQPFDYYVEAIYTPSTGNDAFADRWGTRGHWRISLADIAAHTAAKAGV